MNQGIRIYLSVFFIFVVLFYSSAMVMVHVHEQVHKEIYRTYGVESEIRYDWIRMSWKTVANSTEAKNKCNEFCELAHNQNEIVGYHMTGLVSIIVFLFTIYLMSKIMEEDNGRKETFTNTI
jgi:hypothetical protein